MKDRRNYTNKRRPFGRFYSLRSVAVVIVAVLLAGDLILTNSPHTTAANMAPPNPGDLIISEFRLRGPNGSFDEFVEIFNTSGFDHTVAATAGTGYAVAASDGSVRCVVPNGFVFPNHGRFLCANNNGAGGYSLANYPSGNGSTATPDVTYTLNIPDNAGIALFRTSLSAGFTMANRLDAVGSTAETNALYKEGAGYPALSVSNLEYSFFRKLDPAEGFDIDTDNNAADFLFADTGALSIGAGQRLGAPGPQNQTSPIFMGHDTTPAFMLDATKAASVSPNRVRDFTPDAANNAPFGTISFRRRFRDDTGGSSTRWRFRIIDISGFPAPAGVADLRPRNSNLGVVAGINDAATCAAAGAPSTPCTVSVQGTTLETPPAQTNGGGFNSTLSVGTITLGTPIGPGASIDLQFTMGVKTNGAYHLAFELEELPGGGGMFEVSGNTLTSSSTSDALNRISDFDADGKTDVSVFRPSTGAWYLNRSTAGITGTTWGISTDKITPADYDGDGKTDIAVFRASEGRWYIFNSSNSTFTSSLWGASTDIPAPADYDGDGKADVSIFRPSDGNWWLNRSTAGTTTIPYGQNGDIPAVGDYDGDLKADVAIFRPSNGVWSIHRSLGGDTGYQFGFGTDKLAQADYDGDGKTDIAIYRPSTGQWFIANSGSATFPVIAFGAATDVPVPGDYDGDGKADTAIFRPSDGNWWLNRSSAGVTVMQFGQNGDKPVPNAFGN